jgi:hypothetical protein
LAKVSGIERRVAKDDGIEGGAAVYKNCGPKSRRTVPWCNVFIVHRNYKMRYSGEILHFASNIPFQLADNLSKEQLRKSLYFLEHGFYINI